VFGQCRDSPKLAGFDAGEQGGLFGDMTLARVSAQDLGVLPDGGLLYPWQDCIAM